MAALDIPGFAAQPESLALAVSSEKLPGLFRKALTVPAGTFAYVKDAEGREAVLRAGEERSGEFAGVLVKEGEIVISCEADALPNADGYPTRAGLEVVLAVPPRAIEARELLSTLVRERGLLQTSDLRAYLTPSIRAALQLFVAGQSGEALATKDLRPELLARVTEELKGPCFAAGLDLQDVRHASFACPEYEARRAREAEAKDREADIERKQRLQELQVQLQKNEALKRKEVEELAKVLHYEGVVKDLSLKTELDKKRKEGDLRRYEELHQKLGGDEVKALIFLLDDEKLKADLIRQLAERDMTEEQLRARRSSDVEARLEKQIQELQAKLSSITGERAAKLAKGGTRARRVVGVFGRTVVAFDPSSNTRRDVPREQYELDGRALGFLRSVKGVVTREGPTLLVGAQRGVYVLPESGMGAVAKELRYRREPTGQGGVNAAAYFDGHVYATHSELGLCRWDLLLETAEPLHEVVTQRNDSTRGATVSADGKLFFASGADIFRMDLVKPGADLVAFRGGDDSITTFVATKDEVLAGTRGGRILRWSQQDPGSPRELSVRKAEPIYMLKTAELSGEDHLLVGAKDHGLTAISLADGRSHDFRARDQIRWVDGASDFVVGASRSGLSIHVWDARRPEAEAFEWKVADRLQDLAVQKEALTGVVA